VNAPMASKPDAYAAAERIGGLVFGAA
jgi:hypothetical protein